MKDKNFQCPICESCRNFKDSYELRCNNCGESSFIGDIEEIQKTKVRKVYNDLDITKDVNIAVGCIMASGMTIKEKQVVIDSIRKLEKYYERMLINNTRK